MKGKVKGTVIAVAVRKLQGVVVRLSKVCAAALYIYIFFVRSITEFTEEFADQMVRASSFTGVAFNGTKMRGFPVPVIYGL